MKSSFSCQDEFVSALSEVNILVRVAESNQNKPEEYTIFNKACLLFLVAKFEVFLENVVAEYAFRLEKLRLPAIHFPEIIKLHCARHLIDEQFLVALENLKSSAAERLRELSCFWHSTHQLESIKIDNSFDYGTHGQNAITRLFARIGIEDIFKECAVYEARELLSEGTESQRPVDIAADVNSMTGIRNNILHNDATPNLTHWQIVAYRQHLILFADKLIELLGKSLEELSRCAT